jgi:hypothetical protein
VGRFPPDLGIGCGQWASARPSAEDVAAIIARGNHGDRGRETPAGQATSEAAMP